MKQEFWSAKQTAKFLYPELDEAAGLNALRVLTWRGTIKWEVKRGKNIFYLAYPIKLYGRKRRNRLARAKKRLEAQND